MNNLTCGLLGLEGSENSLGDGKSGISGTRGGDTGRAPPRLP